MSKKKISINPDFFKNADITDNTSNVGNVKKISKKESKKEKRKKREKRKSMNKLLKPNEIKKQLIQKIKEHQQVKSTKIKKKKEKRDDVKQFENEYQESLSYLEQIKREKIKKKQYNRTIKKNKIKLESNNQPKGISSVKFQNDLEMGGTNALNSTVQKEPVYGILKGGKKQLYSAYRKTLKNKNKQRHIYRPNIKLNTSSFDDYDDYDDYEIIRKPMVQLKTEPVVGFDINKTTNELMNFNIEQKLNINQNIVNNDNSEALHQDRRKKLMKLKKKRKPRIKTIKRYKKKFTLGKDKKKGIINVLIKNKKTRKRIKDEFKILTKKPLSEIKEYLRKRNLIKVGNNGSERLLRQLYQDSFLTGDVYNKNVDNLLHNFMNKE